MRQAAVCAIVCVKNAVATLDRTLDSISTQILPPGFGPLETIVIDGGSSDGSAECAARREGVRLLRQQGAGLASARNEAMRATQADFIAFCDADDWWSEDSLRLRLRHFSSAPDIGAVIGKVMLEAVPGERSSPAQDALIGVARPGYTPGALVARRETFARVGPFDETLRIGADSDFFVRLTQSPMRLAVLDHVVLRKGARGASLSGDVGAYRRELLTVARRFLDKRRSDGGA